MRLLAFPIAVLASLTIAGCGGGTGDTTASALNETTQVLAASKARSANITAVTLPATTEAVLGTRVQLVATVIDETGKAVAGAAVTWASADPSIASVGPTGLLKPLKAGSVRVTASAGAATAATLVFVRSTVASVVRSKYVGTNLAPLGYWSSQFPFANLIKGATPWTSREDNGTWNAPFPSMTGDGYPATLRSGQHAVSILASHSSQFPAGRYVALWDGDGALSFPGGIATVVESSTRRIVVDVKAAAAELAVSIDATSAANPLRNLRFLWPGTESTYLAKPFNPEFLKKIQPFSALRFMDWGRTNGSPVVNWADRSKVSDFTYAASTGGVPIEVMIDLANTLRVDPWFCIPHQASDDYVRGFAALLRSRLDPTLKPHIEYSNEVWNTSFPQTTWANQQAERLGLARPFGMPSLFYAQRSVEIFKLMQQVYGADSGRLVRVIAGQAAWTQFLEDALAWKDTASNTDVMAIAPYFRAESAAAVENVDTTLALSSDQIVDQMLADIRGPVTAWIASNASLATRYRLKMKAYESGPTDTAAYFPADKVDAMTALFVAANRNPRMRDVYLEYFGLWASRGGDTMNQYNDIGSWKPWGMWGSLEHVSQDPATAPKYRGLMEFIAAHPTAP